MQCTSLSEMVQNGLKYHLIQLRTRNMTNAKIGEYEFPIAENKLQNQSVETLTELIVGKLLTMKEQRNTQYLYYCQTLYLSLLRYA